jgi:hypothetical protein
MTTIKYGDQVTSGVCGYVRERMGVVVSRARDAEARKRSRKEGERVVCVALSIGGHAWFLASDLRK